MALKYTFHCHVLSFIGILLFVSILHNCESKDYAPRVQTRREVSTAKECLNQSNENPNFIRVYFISTQI